MLSTTALTWTIVAAAICWFFVANQVFALWTAWRDRSGVRYWSVTQGRIAIGHVGVSPTHPSGRDPADAGAIIRYRYRVGEKDYEGDSIRIGGKSRSMGLLAKSLIKKFPNGRPVEVYYDPADPAKSSLEMKGKGGRAGSVIMMIVFGAFAGVLTAHAIAGKMIMMSNGLPMFALGMPIAMVLIFFGCVALYISELRKSKESATWPTTEGRIVKSRVIEHEETRRDDDGDESTSTVYRPDIGYAYSVNGLDYTADTWKGRMKVSMGAPKYAEGVVARYPVGKTVTVHYDPAEPGMAVLEPGNRDGATVPLIVGIVFGLAGMLFLWAMTQAEWVQAV